MEEAPVGAGPFVLESLQRGTLIRLKKSPTYFQADKIKLAGVDWIHVVAGTSTVNAMVSNTVDIHGGTFTYETSKLLGSSSWKIETSPTDNIMLMGFMCKSRPPFNDIRVRQALNYAINRDQLNDLLFDGKGEPMAGWFRKASPLHNSSVDNILSYNPQKARDLLAAAGQSGLTFEALTTPGLSQTATEAIQQQLAQVGVTLRVKALQTTGDFFPNATAAPLYIFPLYQTTWQKVVRTLVPGSFGDVCNWDDPKLNKLMNDIKAAPKGSSDEKKLYGEMQAYTFEDPPMFYGVFGAHATAFNPARLGNVKFLMNFQGKPEVDFYNVYVKK
jgi:peptide/nickel transport system substrate-binding protein/glutathione transport system substrate-binding protein